MPTTTNTITARPGLLRRLARLRDALDRLASAGTPGSLTRPVGYVLAPIVLAVAAGTARLVEAVLR